MSNIRIPQSRRWSGPYLGSYAGTLQKTFNIDLDRDEGKVTLSRRLSRVADTSDTTDTGTLPLGLVVGFNRHNADSTDRYWALVDNGRLFRTDSAAIALPNHAWHADTLANSPQNAYDFTVFGNDSRIDSGKNQLLVTRDSTIAILNDTGNSAWTADWWASVKGNANLRATSYHPIQYFPYRKIVLVGDGNFIHTIQRTSDSQDETTTARRLVLPLEYEAEHIFHTPTRAWILCSHKFGGEGAIVEWDGFSETYNELHRAYSTYPLSGVDYQGIPVIVNNKGMILEYNGRSFSPMTRGGQDVAFPIAQHPQHSFGPEGISRRGMAVGEDRLIYINVAVPINTTPFRNQSGIWCLNPLTGRLYPKHAIGQWGDTDFGCQAVPATGGAVFPINTFISNRSFLFGGLFHKPMTVENAAIWTLEDPTTTTANRGHLVTQWIPSEEVKNVWDVIWVRFKRFITTTNRIVVKARGVRPLVLANGSPLEATITWTGATTFTVTLAASDDALVAGDEVEVIAGDNAGITAHITTVSGNHAALQTVTIDEATPVTSAATAQARFDRWKKLGTMSDAEVYEWGFPIGIDSSFIQFKLELRGPHKQMEVSDLLLASHPSQLITK